MSGASGRVCTHVPTPSPYVLTLTSMLKISDYARNAIPRLASTKANYT